MDNEPSKRELAWRQYALLIDLYKHYLQVLLQLNVFFYGITGAILTFFFANPTELYLKYSLFLPTFLSILLVILCVFGIRQWTPYEEVVRELTDELGLKIYLDLRPLSVVLRISGFLFLGTASGLIILIAFR